MIARYGQVVGIKTADSPAARPDTLRRHVKISRVEAAQVRLPLATLLASYGFDAHKPYGGYEESDGSHVYWQQWASDVLRARDA